MGARRNFHREGDNSKKYPSYGKYTPPPPNWRKGPRKEKSSKKAPTWTKSSKMDNTLFCNFAGGEERAPSLPPPPLPSPLFWRPYLYC